MKITAGNLLCGELADGAVGHDEPVCHLHGVGMTALDEKGCLGMGYSVVQSLGLGQVGRDERAEGEEMVGDISDGIGRHQFVAAGGDHHGVVDDRHGNGF